VYDSLLTVLEELRAGVWEIMPREWEAKEALLCESVTASIRIGE
jgi:hypothetical protein